MRGIKIAVTDLMAAWPDNTHLFGRRKEKARWLRIGRKGGLPAGQQLAWRVKPGLPARMASLRMRTCSFAHGCRIGASGLPISKMGCAPLSKNPALEEACRVSRAGTGPGPDGGARNGPGLAAQPTEGLDAKSGGEAVAA